MRKPRRNGEWIGSQNDKKGIAKGYYCMYIINDIPMISPQTWAGVRAI